MVCILKPLSFIALIAQCAFAIRFCMCAYEFGAPGWIWAPRYTPVLCYSKSFKIGWLFSNSSFCVSCSSFCVSCSLLRRIFDLSRLMMMPCLEQSSMRDSIMAISPSIELDMMCRSSTNIKPATLACFAWGTLTPHFSFWMFVSMSLTYMIKSIGDRTEPCFRPWVMRQVSLFPLLFYRFLYGFRMCFLLGRWCILGCLDLPVCPRALFGWLCYRLWIGQGLQWRFQYLCLHHLMCSLLVLHHMPLCFLLSQIGLGQLQFWCLVLCTICWG